MPSRGEYGVSGHCDPRTAGPCGPSPRESILGCGGLLRSRSLRRGACPRAGHGADPRVPRDDDCCVAASAALAVWAAAPEQGSGPLFDIPEEGDRGIDHTGEILAKGTSSQELSSREIERNFKGALLDPIGKLAAPIVVGRAKPCGAQALDFLVGRPARRGSDDTASAQVPVRRRVDYVEGCVNGGEHTPPALLDWLSHVEPLDDGTPLGGRQLDIEA